MIEGQQRGQCAAANQSRLIPRLDWETVPGCLTCQTLQTHDMLALEDRAEHIATSKNNKEMRLASSLCTTQPREWSADKNRNADLGSAFVIYNLAAPLLPRIYHFPV